MLRYLLPLVFILAACAPPRSTSTTKEITYRVTWRGGATAGTITYQNAQGGTEQTTWQQSPWFRTLQARAGQFVYVSAQNSNDRGAIGCEILVNGQAFKASRSDAGYGIASCSGLVP